MPPSFPLSPNSIMYYSNTKSQPIRIDLCYSMFRVALDTHSSTPGWSHLVRIYRPISDCVFVCTVWGICIQYVTSYNMTLAGKMRTIVRKCLRHNIVLCAKLE